MLAPISAPTPRQVRYQRPWLAPYQLSAIFGPERYALVEATTKAGKTAGCLIWQFEQGLRNGNGRNHWWVAPIYSQAEIAFERMKRGIPRSLYSSIQKPPRLTLANGAVIWFKSAEDPDNLYGEDVWSLVIDEASRIDEESWVAARSTITATRGPARIIGNVKGRKNWFYRMARKAERGQMPDARYAKITWQDAVAARILDAEEIERARGDMSIEQFEELYEAVARELAGRVYRDFTPENVREDVEDLGGDVLIGMDFNVDPMTAVIASRAADELHVWDEIVLSNSNTSEMIVELDSRLERWQRRAQDLAPEGRKAPPRTVRIYPDPSGKSRKTSAAGKTDFSLLSEAGYKVSAPPAAPAVVDRINEVNALACNAKKRRRLFVHPRCKRLIEALDELTYKDGSSIPDKDSGFDHITDALGYLVHREFPIVQSAGVVRRPW